jgi:hypothetical protein
MPTPLTTLGELRNLLLSDWRSLPDSTPLLLRKPDDFCYVAVVSASIVLACPGQLALIWYAPNDDRSNGIGDQQAIFLT